MAPGSEMTRRDFLKAGTTAGTALVIGFHLPLREPRFNLGEEVAASFKPNAFLEIGVDDTITVIVAESEMGQGVMTSLPMIVADELEADWSKVRAEFAGADRESFGFQITAGSSSIRRDFTPLRKAGAAAREMLIDAAARRWGVNRSSCHAENGKVIHTSSRRNFNYGELVGVASGLPVPENPPLKDPSEFRYIGRPMPRVDSPLKVDGSAAFGIDVKVPGMLIASIERCPVFGGRVARLDDSAARSVEGVHHVLEIESGVAVVATNTWAALQGRRALDVTWDEGPNAQLTSAEITRTFQQLAKSEGAIARNDGDALGVLAGAHSVTEAGYEVPYLAHATMEPMNCTADVRRDSCDVWAPTQNQTSTQDVAARITGLPRDAVTVHTMFLGGGFGRRSETDFVADAVEISKALGVPIKAVWSREDDIQHDFYRPATYNRFRAALGSDGWPVAWFHRIVGPSILASKGRELRDGIDRTSVEGAANIPYDIPNVRVEYVKADLPIPVGFWRSVGSSQNAFITESFIDELASLAGKDPYEYRLRLLASKRRHRRVLELAAENASWGKSLPSARHRGMAVHQSFGSFVAQVAEVSVSNTGEVRVHRVVCAIDCGTVVNPDTVRAQMESGIVYGLTAALKGEITIEGGRVKQSNFHDYPMLRMDEMPTVEVHIVDTRDRMGGVGEPGTPPIAPAVANAVFAATGKRVRRLPIRPEQ